MKKKPAHGHTAKHSPAKKKHTVAAKKHHPAHKPAKPTATLGWEPHVVASTASHPKPRKLALGEGVACCSAEALAASLRRTGRSVGDRDVFALYELTQLERNPFGFDADAGASILATLEAAERHGLAGARPVAFEPATELADGVVVGGMLPGGPHAVLLDQGGVWTWGEWLPELASFVVEEAWAVTWP